VPKTTTKVQILYLTIPKKIAATPQIPMTDSIENYKNYKGNPILTEKLKDFFGFDTFKGLQEPIVNNIYNGNNTFVILPTGAGKSLCYQLPALAMEGTAIIVSPLIALMKNQVDSIRAYSGTDGIAEFLNSSLTKAEIKRVRAGITSGQTKMLYVAPESLGKEENMAFFQTVKISFVAVDEAHCISEWGHDFRPEYRRIKQIIAALGNIPIIALTATATAKVQSDILKNLQMNDDATTFKSSFNRENLYYEVLPKINTDKSIIRYIKENANKSGIIYCLSRKKAEEVAELLQANAIKALPYHAGLDAATRINHQDQFLMEECDVIVATIAFGMGIDKPDVRFVIHYDIPKSIESYYQETGRAGRDGLEGVCIAYYSDKDVDKLSKFMKDKSVAEKEIGGLLLKEITNYAQSAICRRKQILHYFGEIYETTNCQRCDSCKNKTPDIDATEDLKKLLTIISTFKNKLSLEHICSFAEGTVTPSITMHKHNTHAEFGFGRHHIQAIEGEKEPMPTYWTALVKYAMIDRFLHKDIENYGLLSISDRGLEYIKNTYQYRIALDYDFGKEAYDNQERETIQIAVMDQVLFDMLKDLRKKIAKQLNLPPYIIFQDPSLEEMTTQYPINEQEMMRITGVGAGKARKHGKPFIELIAQYVIDNDLTRPTDLLVKSTVNKSQSKVFIISNIDRKIMLEDIAQAKGMAMNEFFEEVYSIVNSGTKLNLEYYVDEKIDQYVQQELMEYFRTYPSDNPVQAISELSGDYSDEEIQIMHIKFTSDNAN
jgi:ATP-dependent DNA helicase RecQ